MNKTQATAAALAFGLTSSIALARPLEAPSATNSSRKAAKPAGGYTHYVAKPRASVRPNPGSWYLGSLDKGEAFRVKAVRGQWAFGDARGDVNRRNVWILRNRLNKGAYPTATRK